MAVRTPWWHNFYPGLGPSRRSRLPINVFPKNFPKPPFLSVQIFKNLDNFVQVDIRPSCSHFGRATTDLVHQTLSGVLRRPPQLIEYKETTQPWIWGKPPYADREQYLLFWWGQWHLVIRSRYWYRYKISNQHITLAISCHVFCPRLVASLCLRSISFRFDSF